MLTRQALSQQLQGLVHAFIRSVKARRREEAAVGIAAILFWVGHSLTAWLPDSLQQFIKSWRGDLIIHVIFYGAGAALLGYGVYRIWKLVYVPELPPPANRPSAIKGPLAFTPADGELFRKLGREDELRKLLGHIQDDQVSLVILMGASGAGKTSLLRAGLTDILKDTGTNYHYWEAVPSDSGRGLLTAIKQGWKTRPDDDSSNAPELKSLDELVQPAPELGKHVIVLDQFEQLGAAFNGPVFRLLRKVIREAKPPHRVTWVIAFRREFRANWADFVIPEYERGFFQPELSLRLFTSEQARDVISQLIQAAGLSVEQKVINNLIDAASVEGEVSSVDIGIGLLVLAEMHERQGAKTLTQDIYHFAGGAEGLLTQYISRCLDNYFPDEDRKTLLSAMLALRDAETNQRIAAGKSWGELAAETEAVNPRRLKNYLERLTQRDIRLLEHVGGAKDDAVQYRLPHERLIPALNRLAGTLIGEIEEAKLKFASAYAAWKSDNSTHYLLRGKVLRLVDRYKGKIQWGSEKAEKLEFIKRSKRRRAFGMVVKGLSSVLLVLVVSRVVWMVMNERSWQGTYPTELTGYHRQLKTLELKQYGFDLGDFDLLNSATLEELTINVADGTTSSAKGLAGNLSRCPNLKKLTLHFYMDAEIKDFSLLPSTVTSLYLGYSFTQMKELPKLPSALTELTLDVSHSKAERLPALPDALTALTINLTNSDVKELPPLPNGLTKLNLTLTNSEVKELPPLPNNLAELVLDLRNSQVTSLPPLPASVVAVSLDLRNNRVKELPPLPEALTKLTLLASDEVEFSQLPSSLTELTLFLSYKQSEKLPPLPESLTKLDIILYEGRKVPRLPDAAREVTLHLIHETMNELPQLPEATTVLNLKLAYSYNQMVKVPPLPKNLTALSFDLQGTQVKELPPLPDALRVLSMNLGYSKLKQLPPLPANLVELTLDLSNSQLKELPALPDSLKKLTLNLNNSEVSELPPLPSELTELNLDVGNSKLEELPPLPNSLGMLALNLSYSKVRAVPQLPRSITDLTLDLEESKVTDLPSLLGLNCQKVTLKLTREQRMSLTTIPQSVTKLSY